MKSYLGICVRDFSGTVWTLSRACYDCHHFTAAILGYLHLVAMCPTPGQPFRPQKATSPHL